MIVNILTIEALTLCINIFNDSEYINDFSNSMQLMFLMIMNTLTVGLVLCNNIVNDSEDIYS